jgi:hypothetical protein
MGGIRRVLIGAVLWCGTVIAVTAPGGVAAAQSAPNETFTGTCVFHVAAIPAGYPFNYLLAPGTCTGLLNGQSITYQASFTANDEGVGTTQVPVLLTGPGEFVLDQPFGPGYCGIGFPVTVVQATPLAFAVLGAGGLGLGLSPLGVTTGGLVSFASINLTGPPLPSGFCQ